MYGSKGHGQSAWWLAVMVAVLGSSCDGRLIVTGNVLLTLVPCSLLWVTVNLKKSR